MNLSLDSALLQQRWLNNPAQNYFLALITFLGIWIGFRFFEQMIIKRVTKLTRGTASDVDDFLISLFQSISSWFYIYLAFYGGIQTLNFPGLKLWLKSGLIIFAVLEVGSKIQLIIDYLAKKSLRKHQNKAPIDIIKKIAVALVWLIGGLLILSNLGIDVTSLIAGLGIGGVAVALALQNILGDLFSSFAIYFDKPFEVGDFIIVGQEKGTVEKIGIKTTRIRALQGEEIVIANNDLTNSRINNYKKMQSRRVSFALGVTYDTPQKKLEKIPQIITKVINQVDLAKLDRVHFASFGDFSLNFEVVYNIQSADYNTYMDIQQEINFKLFKLFQQEKIEFAFPSQTIYYQPQK